MLSSTPIYVLKPLHVSGEMRRSSYSHSEERAKEISAWVRYGQPIAEKLGGIPGLPLDADQYPPGTIDGATHPELISDFKAYEVFINCAAVAESAPASEKKLAKDKFYRARLNESDTSVVMKTLGEFFARRLDINKQAEQLTQNKAGNSDFAKLYSQLSNLVSSTRETLMSRLSPEGAAKLHAHVMDLKSRIKIFPPNVK